MVCCCCCGVERWNELLLGVAGVVADMLLLVLLLLDEDEGVSTEVEDHAGTGGLLRLGETAIFLDWCCEEDWYGEEDEGVAQSPDCYVRSWISNRNTK